MRKQINNQFKNKEKKQKTKNNKINVVWIPGSDLRTEKGYQGKTEEI